MAQAWDAGANTALARDTDGDDPAAVEVVWVDDAGPAPSGDAANDGIHSAAGTFTVQTAALAVVKTSTVEEDPVNGTANPLRIPRARVRYSITITNSGAAGCHRHFHRGSRPGRNELHCRIRHRYRQRGLFQ